MTTADVVTHTNTNSGESLLHHMSEAGYKQTGPRRQLIEIIARQPRQFTAAEIYGITQEEVPSIGRATVFRTLDTMTQLGLLERIHGVGSDDCHSYVVCDTHHHHHIVCRTCGKALEFDACDLSDFLQTLGQKTGFQISGHWLEVMGQCTECRITLPDAA